MPLTDQQRTTLGQNIAANGATAPGTTGAISALPHTEDNAVAVAAWYNLEASPAYKVWSTGVDLKAIRSLVNLANYTPTDAPPSATGNAQGTNDALLFNNRALACQLKQANAIFLVTGEGQIDCSPLQLRQSFNDCMTAIPSGASGANQNAGWGTSAAPGAVRLALQRNATNAQKLFAAASAAAPNAGNVGTDPRGATTNPDTLVVVDAVTPLDVKTVWGI
jgi:hypothetical protein